MAKVVGVILPTSMNFTVISLAILRIASSVIAPSGGVVARVVLSCIAMLRPCR